MRSATETPTHFSNPIGPMKQDLRDSSLWKEVDDHLKGLFDPAIGQVSAASDLAASPDGKIIAFTGTTYDSNWRQAPPKTRICTLSIDSESSAESLEVITAGANDERLPKWSPDGKTLAFLSDRAEKGIYQLYLLIIGRLGEAYPIPHVTGTVEDYHWSPDGSKILIQSAGRGADQGDAGGSGKIGPPKKGFPNWMPSVDAGYTSNSWRNLWVYDCKSGRLEDKSGREYNPWEAVWCGSNAFVSIASDSPLEDAWYTASLHFQPLDGSKGVIYVPKSTRRQLGSPVSSPSGKKVAVIEALSSDRGAVAGEIKLIDIETAKVKELQTPAVDIVYLAWKNEACLFFMGLQGLNIVAGEVDIEGKTSFKWASSETCGSLYPTAALIPDGRFAVVLQSWERVPEIAIIDDDTTRTLLSFSHKGHKELRSKIGTLTPFTWTAPDGLELQGHLILPKGNHTKIGLLAAIHGGPTFLWQNRAADTSFSALMNSKGYALFRPNPRGSAGRGQRFAEAVLGDMGGKDAQDIISGIAAICESESRIDPGKIGVFGGSYGGFMASLLPTLTPIFKASVSMSAVTDWHSFHTTSNIPSFDKLFVDADAFDNKGGRYLELSPIMAAGRYKTPVLQTAGANDLAVPYSQAVQYHRALIEKGVESAVIIYPGEGHGVRNYPAMIDIMARTLGWFKKYMSPA